jgi:hypothetical protein
LPNYLVNSVEKNTFRGGFMDQYKSYISYLGGLLAFYGIVSMILWFFNYYLRIFGWMNQMSETTAWIIRIAFVVGGAALYFIFKEKD